MAKKLNKHFWAKFQKEWARLYKKGASVAELKECLGEMLAQSESDPIPPPPPIPPAPNPDDEP